LTRNQRTSASSSPSTAAIRVQLQERQSVDDIEEVAGPLRVEELGADCDATASARERIRVAVIGD
jgi:hypothetical protein